VHITDRQNDFGSIKARSTLGKLAKLSKVEEEFSTCAVVEDKVELLPGLKGHFHTDNEGVINVAKNAALSVRVFDLVALDNIIFSKHFQRIRLSCLDFVHEKYFSCCDMAHQNK
jgi:hypothetical protein